MASVCDDSFRTISVVLMSRKIQTYIQMQGGLFFYKSDGRKRRKNERLDNNSGIDTLICSENGLFSISVFDMPLRLTPKYR